MAAGLTNSDTFAKDHSPIFPNQLTHAFFPVSTKLGLGLSAGIVSTFSCVVPGQLCCAILPYECSFALLSTGTCGGKPATPVSCPGVILGRGARNRRKSRVVCRDS